MKSLVAVAVASALALSGVAASTTGASANGWNNGWNHSGWSGGPDQYWGHRPHPHHSYTYQGGGNNGGALIAGALFGLAAGAIIADAANQPPPPESYDQYAESDPYAESYAEHVAWCRQTYPTSYDQHSDSWTDFEGGTHQCIEPLR